MHRRNSIDRPITSVGQDPSDIRPLPIQECGETLVTLRPCDKIFLAPQYHKQGLQSASRTIELREGVVDCLRCAAALLPSGFCLLIWDGLRSLETQIEIFNTTQETLARLGKADQIEMYLARPPVSETEFRQFPPPHASGGAVDLTLCDQTGKALDLGAEFDSFEETAWLGYFEADRSKCLGRKAAIYRQRRRILYWAMMDAGFAPYPWEYWHYEVGTTVAASFHGHPAAKYGAAVPWVSFE